ncbi:hypothetical protein J3R30DRAFT_3403765 [Lentinula aciculospora]|uniref:Uncharacterized protein n=1 Tax=Lentinula aciculospora TaxID=153920 RepID=A0A9W9ADM3_9AGAR|nr:hypothetical protein J3R30DRAFT_3403765 [Lentinula aciculospora]
MYMCHCGNSTEMMITLERCFKTFEDATFFRSFDVVNVPEIPDRDRIHVRDHPQTKSGHTRRFWCSQDVQHRYRTTLNTVQRASKTKYPCRSRLLVASRDAGIPGYRRVTMRIPHRMGSAKKEEGTWPVTDGDAPRRSFLSPSSPSSSPTETGRDNEVDLDGVPGVEIPHGNMIAEQNNKITNMDPFQSTTSASTSALNSSSNFASPSFSSSSSFGSSSTQTLPISALVSPHFIQPVFPNHPIHANSLVTIGQLQSRGLAPISDPGPIHLNQISRPNSVLLCVPVLSLPFSIPGSAYTSVSSVPSITTETFQQIMRSHIRNIRDFCDGLEYQVQFNDLRLQELEKEGKYFLEEGRLKLDWVHDGIGAQDGHLDASGVDPAPKANDASEEAKQIERE